MNLQTVIAVILTLFCVGVVKSNHVEYLVNKNGQRRNKRETDELAYNNQNKRGKKIGGLVKVEFLRLTIIFDV